MRNTSFAITTVPHFFSPISTFCAESKSFIIAVTSKYSSHTRFNTMRRYLQNVLVISFMFIAPPVTYATEKPHITLRSTPGHLDIIQVQSMSNIYIHSKQDWGFIGYSTINHSYKKASINDNKVVIDYATGLMWHQSGSSYDMTWLKATDWVMDFNSIGFAGYNDWRLPTLEEAASLIEKRAMEQKYYQDRNIDPIFSFHQEAIWTCDVRGGENFATNSAWCVNFFRGKVLWHYMNNVREACFVRLVRSVN